MSLVAEPHIQRHRLTLQEYHRMREVGIFNEDAGIELIEGEIIDMTPVGSEHAGIVKQLNEVFSAALSGKAIVAVQDPLVLGEESEPQPDLCLLQRKKDFYRSAHPRAADVFVVIEVSDTSARYDREIKASLYAHHSIPEVWLVDLEEMRLEVYSGPQDGEYRHVDFYRSGTVSPKAFPEVSVDLEALGFVRG